MVVENAIVQGRIITFKPKEKSKVWRALALVFPFALQSYTTIGRVVWYPPGIDTPWASKVIGHEMCHVRQCENMTVPLFLFVWLFFPVPFFFAWGRWRLERVGYLHDINIGRLSIDDCVSVLWRSYGWCWPKPWMRRWFERHAK